VSTEAFVVCDTCGESLRTGDGVDVREWRRVSMRWRCLSTLSR
jgi:hypothetical protein